MCKIAGKSGIWIVLLLIPFVNIVAIVLIWTAIAEKLGRPSWWGILMLIPIVNLVLMGLLAFSGGQSVVHKRKGPSAVSSASVKSGQICSKCGALASATDKFCPDCGAKMNQ